jgi:DNA (cytosine-5)-methyltransferase 1
VSLFSGVGGFEQGLQRAGIETVLQVENDPWCLSVLARHWPEVQRIDDVRKVGRGFDGIDLVYGGWPCQGNSVAGKTERSFR